MYEGLTVHGPFLVRPNTALKLHIIMIIYGYKALEIFYP